MSSSSNITDIDIFDDTTSVCCSNSTILPAATAAAYAKASYDDVVADYGLFMKTLYDLHSSLNSKFWVPTIGGKPLNLHCLFVEVTQRGGFEKVTSERRWRELSSVFDFPPTATNASFLLRKHYTSILEKYELAYFFKESFKLSLDDSNNNYELSDANIANAYEVSSTHRIPNESSSRFEISSANIANMDQVSSTHQIPNESDDEFEVSNTNNGEKNQVNSTHQIPVELDDDYVLSDAFLASVYRVKSTQQMPSEQQTSVPTPRKRKWKESVYQTIPGFNMFLVEHYSNMRPFYYGKEKAMIKQINLLWSNLSQLEKEVYQVRERAAKMLNQSCTNVRVGS